MKLRKGTQKKIDRKISNSDLQYPQLIFFNGAELFELKIKHQYGERGTLQVILDLKPFI